MKRILIPLDGSGLAERIFPLAVYLAKTTGAEFILLHILERHAPESIHGDRHLTDSGQAETYLDGLASRLRAEGVAVRTHVHESRYESAEAGISEHGRELHADLILLSVHGRAGLHRLLDGSLAQRLAFLGDLPILLARSDDERLGSPRLKTVLVPLDCRGEHGNILPLVASLVGPAGGRVRLTTVVNTYGTVSGSDAILSRFLPSSTATVLEACAEDHREFLEAKRRDLAELGVPAEIDLRRGHTVRRLLAAARGADVDLVALGTHGRSGLSALFEGSVAARVVRGLRKPVLLVPAGTAVGA